MEIPFTLCCSLLGFSFPSLTAPVALGENVALYFLLFWARPWLGWNQALAWVMPDSQRWLSCTPTMGGSLVGHTSHCCPPDTPSCHTGGPRPLVLRPQEAASDNLVMCPRAAPTLVAWEAGASGLMSPFYLLQRQTPGLK